MPQLTVGLDLGHHSIKRVRLQSGFRTVELLDYEQVPVAQDDRPRRERMLEALGQLQGWQAGDVVAMALPGDEVILRFIQLPFADRKRVEQTLAFEIESQIPFPLAEVVFDYLVCESSPRTGSRLLVAAARQETIGQWLAGLKPLGLDPRLMGPDFLACASLAPWLAPSAGGLWGVLDIGHRLSSLVLFGGQRVLFARTLSGGGQQLTEQLAEAFRLDLDRAEAGKIRGVSLDLGPEAELSAERRTLNEAIKRAFAALVRELRQTLAASRAATGDQPLQRLWLCGAGAAVGNLPSYFSEQLGVPTESLRNIEMPGAEKLAATPSGTGTWAKALGLALHAHQGGRRGFVNLRRGPFAFRGDFELVRGRLLHVAMALLILLLLAVGQAVVRYFSLSVAARKIQAHTQEITQAILGKTYPDLDVAIAVMKDNISPANDPLPRLTAVDILRELHQRIPTGVELKLKDINISPKRIQLTGLTDSFEAVEKIRNELGKYECFSDIQTGKTQKTTSGSEVEFSFTIAFGC